MPYKSENLNHLLVHSLHPMEYLLDIEVYHLFKEIIFSHKGIWIQSKDSFGMIKSRFKMGGVT